MSFSSLSPFRRGSLIFPAGRRQQREGLSAVDRRLAARAQPPITRARYRGQRDEGHARRARAAPCAEIRVGGAQTECVNRSRIGERRTRPFDGSPRRATRDSAGSKCRIYGAAPLYCRPINGARESEENPSFNVGIWQRRND